MLPGTMRLCWEGFDRWVLCGFANMHVHVGTVHCGRHLFLVLRPAAFLPTTGPWFRACVWVCVCSCMCASVRGCVCVTATAIWSTCRCLQAVRAADAQLPSWNLPDDIIKRWRGDRSGRLRSAQEMQATPWSVCPCISSHSWQATTCLDSGFHQRALTAVQQ